MRRARRIEVDENKKKKKGEKNENERKAREREREEEMSMCVCVLSERGSSISVDRIPKRKRTPHLPPSAATAAGPLRRRGSPRVYVRATNFAPTPGVYQQGNAPSSDAEQSPSPPFPVSPIFMNFGYAALERLEIKDDGPRGDVFFRRATP